MQKELAVVGFDRLSEYIYRASWSTTEVEHFLYFGADSRQYFTAEFGLRNLKAEEFGVESMVKYGHQNFRLWQMQRDPATACSMMFSLGTLSKISRDPWPRVRLPTISGHDLATLTAGFVRQNLLPIIEHVTDLETYLAFLLTDREPNPWLTGANLMIRVAQVVAVAAQLGRSNVEIREFVRPYDRMIEKRMQHIAIKSLTGIDMYVDGLLVDWLSPTP
jgi:hypothetical protein